MMAAILRKTYRFLASYALAGVLLGILAVLTYQGTLEQVDLGLYAVQKKYFESAFVVTRLFGVIPLALPGAYVVLGLLFVNVIFGGILRLRRSWSRLGLYVTHVGIAFLLVSGFITFYFAEHGYLRLWEGERSDEYVSYYDWEVAVAPSSTGGPVTELLIPQEEFKDLAPDEIRTFTSEALPFDLALAGFLPNAEPRPRGAPNPGREPLVDGFFLKPLPPAKEASANLAGLQVAIREKKSGKTRRGLLWGGERHPLVFEVDGRRWSLDLRKKRRNLPFTVVLDRFIHKTYPRTMMPSEFTSEITKIEKGVERPLRITMNEPLRRGGYTLYQSGWGPENAPPGSRHFSVFAVVRNPADQFPLLACIVIALGLLLHFVPKFLTYLERQAEKRS